MLTKLQDTEHLITIPAPKPHQVPELLDASRFKVSVHGRRWGKSTMGLAACLGGHGPGGVRIGAATQGATIWWVAPSHVVGKIIWRLLKKHSERGCLQIHEVEKRIDYHGGGSVTVKTAEGAVSLRGEGLDGLVVDEAAFLAEGLWQEELRPALSDKQGWAWFITTPNGLNWFHRLYRAAVESPKWAAWQGPTTTETVAQSELDDAKKDLGSHAYRQEYLAEFVAPGGGFFKRENFRYYLNGGGTYKLGDKAFEVDKCRRFATVDLAASTKTQADYTVVSTFAVSPSKDLILLDLQRTRMEGPDQVPLIKRCFERWRPSSIEIESVGYQLSLIQAARREGLPIRELKRDKDKVSRACFLQARIEGGGFWLPESAPWLVDVEDELCSFPTGEHDDIVDTLADGAIHVANSHTPQIRRLD